MSTYLRIPPAIRWGTGYKNRIDFGFLLDQVRAYDMSRAASESVQSPSGVEDAWTTGRDYMLESVVRWIPGTDTSALPDPSATGWDGALGWREMLAWARDKNQLAFSPDGRNLLRSANLESASDVQTPLATSYSKWAGSIFGSIVGTITFDATADSGRGAWKLVGSNTGTLNNIDLQQFVPARAGETFCMSVDIFTPNLTGGAAVVMTVYAYDASATLIAGIVQSGNLSFSSGFLRFSTGISSAAPAGTAFVSAVVHLSLPNGGTGTAFVKRVMLRRGATDMTFLENPSILSYLVDDNATPPDPEDDGTRVVPLRIRNGTTPYDGY